MELLAVPPLGAMIKIVGAGQNWTGPVLRLDEPQLLEATPERVPFDGGPVRFRFEEQGADCDCI